LPYIHGGVEKEKKLTGPMNKNILHIDPTENKTIFNILSAPLKLGVYVSHSHLGK